jgi:hypothetical protein
MSWGSRTLFFGQCVAAGTVLAQALFLGAMLGRGDLTRAKATKILRALDGVDVDFLLQSMRPREEIVVLDAPSYEEVIENRIASRLDLDLREAALEKGRQETRELQVRLKSAGERYEVLKRQFDLNFSRLAQGAADQRLVELQENIESMRPAQAKEQILRLLAGKSEDAFLNDVVSIIKTMSPDKRKKLLAEFQTPEEVQLLAKVFDRIRRGLPDALLYRETRSKLRVDHDAERKAGPP